MWRCLYDIPKGIGCSSGIGIPSVWILHVVFENEFSAAFFNSAWRQFRKRNAYPTAITQNVEYLLDSVQASTMLSNSEFIVMLNQAASDREKLGKLLNISNEQMSLFRFLVCQ